jgi:mannose-6-phosphate isomerase-like protein (cupin superfamily)
MASHIVVSGNELVFDAPSEFEGHATGYLAAPVVDEPGGGVQMGFRVATLADGGEVEAHLHSFEETFFVVEGSMTVDIPEGSFTVTAGDYGLLPVGVTHGFRNTSGGAARFAEMTAPLPRRRFGYDTYFPGAIAQSDPAVIDVRDPRTRSFGHIDPENMDPASQTQDRLALSASMRTALLVYSGISVKMMVDSDLGADLSTMFMVQYEPNGFAGAHDHPLEEAYLILEGEVEATFDGVSYQMRPGDVAWAGVGCVHAFRNTGQGRVRWLETQAPQPPARHSYRFDRDWSYLTDALGSSDG